jgi:hypothetical protein
MTDTDTTELVYQARLRASRKCLDGYAVPFDVNLDNALADTIERLTRERDEADAAAEAHEAKWQAFCKAPVDPDGAGTCACSYDQPGDVCLFHSPKLAAAEARIAKLEAEGEKVAKAAFLAGFNISGEGWNGEYPFGDKCKSPETDASFLDERAAAIRALKEPT